MGMMDKNATMPERKKQQGYRLQLLKGVCLLWGVLTLSACNAFMHGYTQNKALNAYTLTGDYPKSFGHKRLAYVKGFHHHSALANFLSERPSPSFFYEYLTKGKCRGISLFYTASDSVFTFEEPRRGNLNAVCKGARKMDDYERETYQRLKKP